MLPLGVGLIYFDELYALFEEDHPELSVLELEPETFWDKVHPGGIAGNVAYVPNAQPMARIATLPQRKLAPSQQ